MKTGKKSNLLCIEKERIGRAQILKKEPEEELYSKILTTAYPE